MGFTSYKGTIKINENTVKNIKDYALLALETSTLIQESTVFENLNDLIIFEGTNKSKEEIIQILKQFNIENKIDEKVYNLSGGEKARVLLARTLLSNKKIILFDEITSALDSLNTEIVFKFLKELSKDHLVICATHSLSVKDYADSILKIENYNLEDEKINDLKLNDIKYEKTKTHPFKYLKTKFSFKGLFREFNIIGLIMIIIMAFCIESTFLYQAMPEDEMIYSLNKENGKTKLYYEIKDLTLNLLLEDVTEEEYDIYYKESNLDSKSKLAMLIEDYSIFVPEFNSSYFIKHSDLEFERYYYSPYLITSSYEVNGNVLEDNDIYITDYIADMYCKDNNVTRDSLIGKKYFNNYDYTIKGIIDTDYENYLFKKRKNGEILIDYYTFDNEKLDYTDVETRFNLEYRYICVSNSSFKTIYLDNQEFYGDSIYQIYDLTLDNIRYALDNNLDEIPYYADNAKSVIIKVDDIKTIFNILFVATLIIGSLFLTFGLYLLIKEKKNKIIASLSIGNSFLGSILGLILPLLIMTFIAIILGTSLSLILVPSLINHIINPYIPLATISRVEGYYIIISFIISLILVIIMLGLFYINLKKKSFSEILKEELE